MLLQRTHIIFMTHKRERAGPRHHRYGHRFSQNKTAKWNWLRNSLYCTDPIITQDVDVSCLLPVATTTGSRPTSESEHVGICCCNVAHPPHWHVRVLPVKHSQEADLQIGRRWPGDLKVERSWSNLLYAGRSHCRLKQLKRTKTMKFTFCFVSDIYWGRFSSFFSICFIVQKRDNRSNFICCNPTVMCWMCCHQEMWTDINDIQLRRTERRRRKMNSCKLFLSVACRKYAMSTKWKCNQTRKTWKIIFCNPRRDTIFWQHLLLTNGT